MRVYVVLKYYWMEFYGIALVTSKKNEAKQFCKQKNRKSRDFEYRIVGKNLKGIEHE